MHPSPPPHYIGSLTALPVPLIARAAAALT